MSRRTAIIEEFDDDTDLPLPSRSLPNTGTHGALLEAIDSDISDDDDDDDDAPELLDLSTQRQAGPASPQGFGFKDRDRVAPGENPNIVTDITPYKK